VSDQSEDDWLKEQDAEVRRIKIELLSFMKRLHINPGVAAVAMAETINLILRTAPNALLGRDKVRQLRNILVAIIRNEEGD
jgi:hypothetical protein